MITDVMITWTDELLKSLYSLIRFAYSVKLTERIYSIEMVTTRIYKCEAYDINHDTS